MLLDVRLARARASLGPSLNLRFGRNLVLRSAGQEFRVPDDRLPVVWNLESGLVSFFCGEW